uniref:cholecystokinin-like n=1 Tax=Pristiophorus japonicus TaxID=55135 RepID=UPI00398F6A6A
MYNGICVCVFFAVLSSGCMGRSASGSDDGGETGGELKQSLPMHQRQVREAQSTDQGKAFQDSQQQANLGALLTRYLQQVRKGSLSGGAIVGSKQQNADSSHRISDRDYIGWMDFGRRSAEEYEYSS